MKAVLPGPRGDPPAALALVGALAVDVQRACEAAEQLGRTWGGVDLRGRAVPFASTDYYESELGPALQRTFFTFGRLISPERLIDLKTASWGIERQFSRDGSRTVNLDAGYLDGTKVVLASFKAGPQKLYLGDGVWADMVLYYQNGAFGPLPWTFPDLRDEAHWPFFMRARARLKQLRRTLS